MNKFILKNLKNEITEITFEMPENGVYNVEQLKKDLCHSIRENFDEIELKIIFNGTVLPNDRNIATEEYIGKSMVYMKSPKKKNQPKKENVAPAQSSQQIQPAQSSQQIQPAQPLQPEQPAQPVQIVNLDLPGIARGVVNSTIAILMNNPLTFRTIMQTIPQVNQHVANGVSLDAIMSNANLQQIMNEMRNITGDAPVLPQGVQIHVAQPNFQNLSQILHSMGINLNADYDGDDVEYDDSQDSENGDNNGGQFNIPNLVAPQVQQQPPLQQGGRILRRQQNQNIMDQFNDQEVIQIQNIVNLGFDVSEVVQMYVACDKNADLTIHNLMRLN